MGYTASGAFTFKWPFAYFECENSIMDTSTPGNTRRGQFVPLGSSCKAVCPNQLFHGVGKDLNKRVDTLMDTLTCTRPIPADQWHSDEYWKMIMSKSPQWPNTAGEEYFEKNWYDTPIEFGFSGSPHISFYPVSSLPETDIWRAYKSGVLDEVAKCHEIIDTTCDQVISNDSVSVECSDGNNPGSICSMQCKAGMIILYSTQILFLPLT